MIAGMQLAREIAAQSPLRGDRRSRSSSRAPARVDRSELEADLRRRLMLIYHPVGTARMSDTARAGRRRLAAARARRWRACA